MAWSGRGRIKRVDVSAAAGKTWREAVVQGPILPRALTRFRFPWQWDGAPTLLQSRAIDASGYVQLTVGYAAGLATSRTSSQFRVKT